MSAKENYGEMLRRFRIEAGFGLRKFAHKLDIRPSQLSFIEDKVFAPRHHPQDVIIPWFCLKAGTPCLSIRQIKQLLKKVQI